MTVKELSGMFMAAERWQALMQALMQPDCGVTHVRLFHNTAQHVADLLSALSNRSACSSGVTRLFIGDLDPAGAQALTAFLVHPQCRVQQLELQQLSSPATAALALAPGLRQAASLQSMLLQRCEDDGAVAAIALAMAQRSATLDATGTPAQPVRLALQRCRVGAAASPALGMLVGSGSTDSVAINACRLSDSHLAALLSAAGCGSAPSAPPSPHSPLHTLDLSDNSLSPASAATLGGALPNLPALTTLVLANNGCIGDSGVAALVASLATRSSSSLTHLDLAGCCISASGATQLAQLLSRSDATGSRPLALRRLVLDRNPIGAAGLAALTRALAQISGEDAAAAYKLECLGISACQISGSELAGLRAGCPASEDSPLGLVVRELQIGNNLLGDAGMAWVANTLLGGGADKLQELDVSACGLGDGGADTLMALLARNRQLNTLRAGSNAFRDRAAARLCSAVEQHPAITCFRADNCSFLDAGTKARVSAASRLVASRASTHLAGAAGSDAAPLLAMRHSVAVCAAPAASNTMDVDAASGSGGLVRTRSTGLPVKAAAPAQLAEQAAQPTLAPRHSGTGDSGVAAEGIGGVVHLPAAVHHGRYSSGMGSSPVKVAVHTKHRLEQQQPGAGDAPMAKQHHSEGASHPGTGAMTARQPMGSGQVTAGVNVAKGKPATEAGPRGGASLTNVDVAALAAAAWQPGEGSGAALLSGKTFTGCSATSLGAGSCVSSSPTSASCVAYIHACAGAGDFGKLPQRHSLDTSGAMAVPSKPTRGPGGGLVVGSADQCTSWMSAAGAKQRGSPERTSGGSSCSAGSRYSRRFRPLTEQQQALFAEF